MSQPSVSRHHADWLSLVEVSGPFVSLPVLVRIFPQGLEPRDPAQARALRAAYEEWQDNPAAPGNQRAWVMHVLTAVLGYAPGQIAEGQTLPAGLEAKMPEMGETLRPDFALVGPAGGDTAGQPQLLIASYTAEQALDKPVISKHWKATPATRMMELLHGTGVSLGLVTNGEHWMLVYAPRGETTGYASWYGALWLDEPITLRAFHSLFGVRRFFGVAADSTLLAMLKESANDQQEVTDQLGYQVREAVEVLVRSVDALDRENHRALLKGVPETVLYDAALTIMMRLVFLFAAEERGLLHLGKPLYDDNYAVSTLQEQLQEIADQHGEEVLERRFDAWTRLLATFRAVHGGIQHQDLLMPAYGGSLFDPDRYPFLEGRVPQSSWRTSAAEPLAVNNRVVLHLLNSLQRLRVRVPGGGPAESRRISFRALGVEQIGHVYEGLLDRTAVRASEPVLGITGARHKEQEFPLAALESLFIQGQDKLLEFLKEETGRSLSALRHALEDVSLLDEHRLLIACGHDKKLLERIRPFANLIREDSFSRPLVTLNERIHVTTATTRRSTGTHYTPPSLTEPIVRYTLEPLIYEGPAEGFPREQWQLKLPKTILDLKICDMAMGSGAFLVQACRYMAERLVEAWENLEKQHLGEVLITPEGAFSTGSPSERLVPADLNERVAVARRIVADRCLYGVDINPMAVEMAKLSLWLITLQRDRPFSFLDHALKCGDSLLGVDSVKQIENFSLQSGESQITFATANLFHHVEEASTKRSALEVLPSNNQTQIEAKNRLHAEAEAAAAKVKALADCLIAFEMRGLEREQYDQQRSIAADRAEVAMRKSLPEFQAYAHEQMARRRTFHWPVEFPEVFARGGFDAFVGNPPFYAGSWLRTLLGEDYRKLIVAHIAEGRVGIRGTADLCVYFLLRTNKFKKHGGFVGLILNNAVCDGDSKAVGIDALAKSGSTMLITSARKWPGTASVTYVSLWLFDEGSYSIADLEYTLFRPRSDKERDGGQPFSLQANASLVCKGHELQGDGFKLSITEANELRANDSKNADVIFPLITGEVLNSSPKFEPQAFVINFGERSLDEAKAYSEPFEIVRQRVKPERDLYVGDTGRDRYLRKKWWLFRGYRADIEEYSHQHSQMLVCTVHTKFVAFAFIQSRVVATPSMFCFLLDQFSYFALLQSSIHDVWATLYASALGETIRYVAGRCFNTFPMPSMNALASLDTIGRDFYNLRSKEMILRNQGLTDFYNRFHHPEEKSDEIARLRALHVEMDRAVAAAYGWNDLDFGQDFHPTKQGVRYTISELARRTVIERLLALNHQRHVEEETEKAAPAISALVKRGRKKRDRGDSLTLDLLLSGETDERG